MKIENRFGVATCFYLFLEYAIEIERWRGVGPMEYMDGIDLLEDFDARPGFFCLRWSIDVRMDHTQRREKVERTRRLPTEEERFTVELLSIDQGLSV